MRHFERMQASGFFFNLLFFSNLTRRFSTTFYVDYVKATELKYLQSLHVTEKFVATPTAATAAAYL